MSTATGLVSTTATPAGPFTVVTTEIDGITTVLASGWTEHPATLTPQIAPRLRPVTLARVGRIDGVTDAVIAYHDGDVGVIDDVPVHQESAEFRRHAWDVLRTVKPGDPVTYTEYAALAGRPAAIRAAAGACASNAAALFVPCHRVLRSDGSLGGFRWGLPVKQWLIDHEQR